MHVGVDHAVQQGAEEVVAAHATARRRVQQRPHRVVLRVRLVMGMVAGSPNALLSWSTRTECHEAWPMQPSCCSCHARQNATSHPEVDCDGMPDGSQHTGSESADAFRASYRRSYLSHLDGARGASNVSRPDSGVPLRTLGSGTCTWHVCGAACNEDQGQSSSCRSYAVAGPHAG